MAVVFRTMACDQVLFSAVATHILSENKRGGELAPHNLHGSHERETFQAWHLSRWFVPISRMCQLRQPCLDYISGILSYHLHSPVWLTEVG